MQVYGADKLAISFSPDVMLLDIGLPGLSGLEVVQRLRAQPAFDKMLLVALTGYGYQAERDQTLAAGFDHHLVKPADFGRLQMILDSLSSKTIETVGRSAQPE